MAGQALRGFVGQSMAAKKKLKTSLLAFKDSNASETSYTATKGCTAYVFATGAGASGASNLSTGGGGGGPAAGYKKIKLLPGWTLSWSAGVGGLGVTSANGNDGGDTTVTYPGVSLTAGGGKGGTGAAAGIGGLCSGPWDIVRNGALGGSTAGGSGGSPTPGGGTGGAGQGAYGGGAGAAGFTDMLDALSLLPGNGESVSSTAATFPGGSTGASNGATSNAKAGRVVVFVFRAVAG